MLYRITKTRKNDSKCSVKHCGKDIARVEYAYTSSKKHFCGPCGHLENQYDADVMDRPPGNDNPVVVDSIGLDNVKCFKLIGLLMILIMVLLWVRG